MEDDALVEVPLAKWAELRDCFLKNWTTSVPHYYALHMNIKIPAIREAFQFKLYSPYGDTDNGLVAITIKDEMDVLIMPISKNTEKLEEAVLRTKRINWTRKVCVDLMCPTAVKIVRNLEPKLGLTQCKIMPTTTFFYDRNREPFSDLTIPEGTYLQTVKKEDITQVDNSWPYKHSASFFYFTSLTDSGLSYGLYSSETHTLLAWVFINEYSFVCNLYCKEPYRRFGYARFLIKTLVNEQLKKGEDVYCFVVEGNEKSLKLFKSLDFKIIEEFCWGYALK